MKTQSLSYAVVALSALLLTAAPLEDTVPAQSAPTFASAVAVQTVPLFTVMSDAQMAMVTGTGDGTKYAVCGGLGVFVGVMGSNPFGGMFIGSFCRWIWDQAT